MGLEFVKRRACLLLLATAFGGTGFGRKLWLNDLGYFETAGLNVLVFTMILESTKGSRSSL